MTFDYKGWGDSAGPRSRLAPYSRVQDVQAAMTFLTLQEEVDPGSHRYLRHQLWWGYSNLGGGCR